MRSRRVLVKRRIASIGALGAAIASSFGGCLEDLPAATECPPPAENAVGDCLHVFDDLTPNCMTDRPHAAELFSCMMGPRPSCACDALECPTTEASCYPEGDCPPEVIEVAGSKAKCLRLDAEDYGLGYDANQQCICGCAECASVCDGKGPTIGVVDDGHHFYVYPLIDLSKHMPSSGKLGIYVRARGVSNVQVASFTGAFPDNLVNTSIYYLTTPLDQFTSQVFYGKDFIGNTEPYAWSTEEEKPTVIALANSLAMTVNDPPISTFYELDCIIPFVVPN